ncbi:hypothetical protein DFQ13_107265 [Actinokineospora spheciospongiae]|nr:hypothetical protein DFQ13_107265 [Actinokineospora spheciospongiae]
MHEIISLCKARDVTTLHLGYAGSDSLARFKCKWGATKTGPDYTEAIYADPEIDGYADIAQRYSFFWNSRMHEISASRD